MRSKTALKGYLAEKEFEGHPDKIDLLVSITEEGKVASAKVVQYVDWLLSTQNPLPPDSEVWLKPNAHPCQIRHENIISSDVSDFDYIDLLNSVQRHTHCSTSYCLRKKGNDTELKCRFNFPFDLCEETKLEFEEIYSKDKTVKYRTKIVTKRNDSRFNAHQRLQLQGWRANCDIQIVTDFDACLEYLTKYASKSEPKSPALKYTLHVNQNSESSKIIRKLMIKPLREKIYLLKKQCITWFL